MANRKIFADDPGQCVSAARCPGHGSGNAALHFCVNRFTHHIEDVFFGGEIFIQRPNRRSGRPGDLARSGFVEPFFDKQLNRGVGNLAASALYQIRILDLGGYVFCPDRILHVSLCSGGKIPLRLQIELVISILSPIQRTDDREYRISRNKHRVFPSERSLDFHSMFLFFLSRFCDE